MLVFLALNGYELQYTQTELSDTILSVATGKLDTTMDHSASKVKIGICRRNA